MLRVYKIQNIDGNSLMTYDTMTECINNELHRDGSVKVIDIKILQEFDYSCGDYMYRALLFVES